jgi:hypothetical protein
MSVADCPRDRLVGLGLLDQQVAVLKGVEVEELLAV